MRFKVDRTYKYFCCSTLPILNGDIKMIVDEYYLETYSHEKTVIMDLGTLLYDLHEYIDGQLKTLRGPKLRAIKREYKRMRDLYRYRIIQEGRGVYHV